MATENSSSIRSDLAVEAAAEIEALAGHALRRLEQHRLNGPGDDASVDGDDMNYPLRAAWIRCHDLSRLVISALDEGAADAGSLTKLLRGFA